MKVLCAWCCSEGKLGYLGEREPLENPASTHGVCASHKEHLLESFPSRSFPDAELLIVVHRNDTALYEYLQRLFADVSSVKVLVDRRGGGPPTGPRSLTHRRTDRGKRVCPRGVSPPRGLTHFR